MASPVLSYESLGFREALGTPEHLCGFGSLRLSVLGVSALEGRYIIINAETQSSLKRRDVSGSLSFSNSLNGEPKNVD